MLMPANWANWGNRVENATATLLNFYTPARFEQVIMAGGLPAEAFTLPPKRSGMNINQPQMRTLFETIGMHVVG